LVTVKYIWIPNITTRSMFNTATACNSSMSIISCFPFQM